MKDFLKEKPKDGYINRVKPSLYKQLAKNKKRRFSFEFSFYSLAAGAAAACLLIVIGLERNEPTRVAVSIPVETLAPIERTAQIKDLQLADLRATKVIEIYDLLLDLDVLEIWRPAQTASFSFISSAYADSGQVLVEDEAAEKETILKSREKAPIKRTKKIVAKKIAKKESERVRLIREFRTLETPRQSKILKNFTQWKKLPSEKKNLAKTRYKKWSKFSAAKQKTLSRKHEKWQKLSDKMRKKIRLSLLGNISR